MSFKRVTLPPAANNDDSLEEEEPGGADGVGHILGEVPPQRGCTPKYDAEEEWVYTVPEEVTFKNYSAEGGKTMTRRLLVSISEDSPLSKRKIHISSPSIHRDIFSVKETLGGHEIEAGGTLILTVVFQPPDASSGDPLDVQDWIQILDKPSKRVLQVPLRAVFKGTDSKGFYPPNPPPPIRPKTTGTQGAVGPDNLLASVLQQDKETHSRAASDASAPVDPLAVLQAADALLEEVAAPLPSSSPQRKPAVVGGAGPGARGGGDGSVSWTEEELRFYSDALKAEERALKEQEEEVEDDEVFPNWEGAEEEKEFYKSVLVEEEAKLRESLAEAVSSKRMEAEAASQRAEAAAAAAAQAAQAKAGPTFFIEQRIDEHGNVIVEQPSVVVKDPAVVSTMGDDVFLIDGVYVNALGEEVAPPAAALPTTPGEGLGALAEEEYTVSGRLVLEGEEERGRARRAAEEEEEELMPWQLPPDKASKLLRKGAAAGESKGAAARGRGEGAAKVKPKSGGRNSEAASLLAERLQAKQAQAGRAGAPQRIVQMGEKVVEERLRTSGSGGGAKGAKGATTKKEVSLPAIGPRRAAPSSEKMREMQDNWDALGT